MSEPAPVAADRTARRSYARVLVPGVLAAALAAVASAKPWADLAGSVAHSVPAGSPGLADAGQAPLASALSLVTLAAWGAVLVTRGRVRRVVTVVGLVAATALLVVAVVGAWSAPHGLRDALDTELALPSGASSSAEVALTGWYWVALVAAVLTAAAFAFAVRYVGTWPAMGTRYDAPGARPTPEQPSTSQEIWKAIDEGNDPTA